MNTYIVHPSDNQLKSIDLYLYDNDQDQLNSLNDISDLNESRESDNLIYLIPSSLVSSYKFVQNKDVSYQINLANFVAEIDTFIVGKVSDNEYFFHNENGYAVDKSILDLIHDSLTFFNGSISIIPEHYINFSEINDVITQVGEKFIFSNTDGTGFSTYKNSLEEYLGIIQNDKPDFSPDIFSDEILLKNKFNKSNYYDDFNYSSFILSDLKSFPNLYKFRFSYEAIKNKFNFSFIQTSVIAVSILAILIIPNYLIYKNNVNAATYMESTFNIFKSINQDIKRVVRPRQQIDEILENVPSDLYKPTTIPNLDFVEKLGISYIKEVSINIADSESMMIIQNMPQLQYEVVKKMSTSFGITITNESVNINDGLVNGNLEINYAND